MVCKTAGLFRRKTTGRKLQKPRPATADGPAQTSLSTLISGPMKLEFSPPASLASMMLQAERCVVPAELAHLVPDVAGLAALRLDLDVQKLGRREEALGSHPVFGGGEKVMEVESWLADLNGCGMEEKTAVHEAAQEAVQEAAQEAVQECATEEETAVKETDGEQMKVEETVEKKGAEETEVEEPVVEETATEPREGSFLLEKGERLSGDFIIQKSD